MFFFDFGFNILSIVPFASTVGPAIWLIYFKNNEVGVRLDKTPKMFIRCSEVRVTSTSEN